MSSAFWMVRVRSSDLRSRGKRDRIFTVRSTEKRFKRDTAATCLPVSLGQKSLSREKVIPVRCRQWFPGENNPSGVRVVTYPGHGSPLICTSIVAQQHASEKRSSACRDIFPAI